MLLFTDEIIYLCVENKINLSLIVDTGMARDVRFMMRSFREVKE